MSSSSSPTKIIVLGSTGFIGGDILYALLVDKSPNWQIAALTGSPSKASQISQWAQKQFPDAPHKLIVEIAERSGDTSQYYKQVEKIAEQYDVVIQAATSDDLNLTKAINRGLESGKKNGHKGQLIHFSGVQLIESEPVGKFVETPYYDDSDLKQIESIPDSAAHRSIDQEVDRARLQGQIAGSIICPALVWGQGRGPVSKVSQQVPEMVRKAIVNGQPVFVGDGTNVWTAVNVNEMIEFVMALLKYQLSDSYAPKNEQWDTFYFAVHDELITFKDLAAAVGKGLAELDGGKLLKVSSEPKSVPVPSWDKSQKGVRVEDDARQNGEQAEIEKRTPFWPNRTNNRAKHTKALPTDKGKKWFPTKYTEKHMIEDTKWIVDHWKSNGTLPKYEP